MNAKVLAAVFWVMGSSSSAAETGLLLCWAENFEKRGSANLSCVGNNLRPQHHANEAQDSRSKASGDKAPLPAARYERQNNSAGATKGPQQQSNRVSLEWTRQLPEVRSPRPSLAVPKVSP